MRVLVDQDLTGSDYWMCNGATAGEALAYLLRLNSVPTEQVNIAGATLSAQDWIAVAPANVERLPGGLSLRPVAASPPSRTHCDPASIELYEIQSAS